MKSAFFLAFNEICREKQLPPEIVIEALQTALVSAYRRDNSVSSSQEVTADIDLRTGEVSVFAEKEVVEGAVIDTRTEITLSEAVVFDPNVQPGDMVMAESTPKNFGRIAAQTAKQVILQRVREAERDHLYDEFSGRADEILNGTVQGLSGGNITIGLGRTEAILPRSQQVRGERYRPHDKIRVYVLEVRKTTRGPQIVVSRSHRNLLRRLLELEVPEIYNGQVDIKSIAREAGARSKIAVQAMQPGVDPVGACVGMRGVRIQSIVRELNDEKIDVIEWDDNATSFIAKALSPARVAHVFLDDDPIAGRTATVIVPDDQLSLAIGREGQNARLAAKLTSWRIDIKSLTESARDSFALLDHPDAGQEMVANKDHQAVVQDVLDKKDANRPITAEDYGYISRFVAAIEGNVIASRASRHDEMRIRQTAAHAEVPELFWSLELEELNLPLSIHKALTKAKYENVGAVVYQMAFDSAKIIELEELSEDSLPRIEKRIQELKEEKAEEAAVAEAEAQAIAAAEAAEAAASDDAIVEEAEEAEPTQTTYTQDAEDADFVQAILGVPEDVVVEKDSSIQEADLDDLSQSLIDMSTDDSKDASLRIVRSSTDESENSSEQKPTTKKKAKRPRQRPDWDDDEWADYS